MPSADPSANFTICPSRRFSLLVVSPVVVILLPRLILNDGSGWAPVWGALLALALAVPALAWLSRIRLDEAGVAVRQGFRSSVIPWTQLEMVRVRTLDGQVRMYRLVLDGKGKEHVEFALTLVRLDDRRRLLAGIEQRVAPGVVHRDAAMQAMLSKQRA